MTNPDCSEAEHRDGSGFLEVNTFRGESSVLKKFQFVSSIDSRAYAFGSTVKERTASFTFSYKFSMNTQEKEPELGEGVTSAEFWVYDGKLGRRWNVDPEFSRYPWFSSYMTFGGNPVLNNDINGDIFGLSTKKQRTAAKEVSKITGGKVNNRWSKHINVTWTEKDRPQINAGQYGFPTATPKEIETLDLVHIKSPARVNRRRGFAKDGSTLYTQKISNGKWEDIIFQEEKEEPLFRTNNRSPRPIFAGDKFDTKIARDQAAQGELDADAYLEAYDRVNDINNALFLGFATASLSSGSRLAVNRVSQVTKGGTTVLGHYPEYVKLAESLGARRFQIPTSVWNKMSAAEQWTANTKFLDRMIL